MFPKDNLDKGFEDAIRIRGIAKVRRDPTLAPTLEALAAPFLIASYSMTDITILAYILPLRPLGLAFLSKDDNFSS